MKRSILYVLLTGWLLGAVSCVDDEIRPFDDVPKGETTVGMTVEFNPFGEALAAKTRATAGDAVKSINSLCVLVYDVDGKLVKKYPLNKGIQEGEYQLMEVDRSTGNKETSWSGAKIAEAKTQQAKFKMSLPYGYYRIYAVANMGDMSAYEEDIKTVKGLKAISFNWNEDVAKNNQMLGHFTDANTYTSNDLLKIAEPNMTLRAGIKRMVSKVTLAFDGSQLKEGVFIYIKSVRIMDAPKTCSLGNPNTPIQDEELMDGDTIRYDLQKNEEGKWDSAPFNEYYLARVTKGRPYYPHAVDNYQQKAFHTETERALFFYENMQGVHEDCDKRQDANGDGELDYPGSSTRPKDGVPYGTWIEVDAYYNSIHEDRVSHGDIKYRFMLGKNTMTDYNAERNHHYKLTLKFKNFANDVDWHIDYEEEEPSIQVPAPYYISYLYNHQVMVPVKVNTGGKKLISLRADIDTNSWAPYGTKILDYHKKMDPYSPEFNGVKKNWNGFLSLRKTKTTLIGDGTESATVAEQKNQTYYIENNRGWREYDVQTTGNHTDADGDYSVTVGDDPNTINILIPMYTRAKQLGKATGYTGNNPYVAYQRKSVVKYTAVLEDANGHRETIKENGTIMQVRRVVNPKGIWRAAGSNAEPFHVVLYRLPLESAKSFETFTSEGKWKAYQVNGDKGFVSLTGAKGSEKTGDTIKGQTGTLIDFTINFEGNCGADQNRFAIIRVEYHDYSCYHLIFVRQGDAPVKLMDGDYALWRSCNMRTATMEASCPVEEGSMFKFGNWNQPIDATNNENRYSYGSVVTSESFGSDGGWKEFLIAGTNSKVLWNGITNKSSSDIFSDPPLQPRVGKSVSVATAKDYNDLWYHEDIGFGYGVMYGNEATETLSDVAEVYGHRYDTHQTTGKGYGMRGIFIYNMMDGRNLFLPIGATGYGHRKYKETHPAGEVAPFNWDWTAVLRYSQGRYKAIADDRPLFYDLYMRPGAIYWLKKSEAVDRNLGAKNPIAIGWDINYFTFDFNYIDTDNLVKSDGSDACFVRCVEYE